MGINDHYSCLSTSKHPLTNYFKNAHLSKVALPVILYRERTQKNSRGKKTANLE